MDGFNLVWFKESNSHIHAAANTQTSKMQWHRILWLRLRKSHTSYTFSLRIMEAVIIIYK